MTVTSILLNFRAALVALVPMVERVGICWKRPDSYDEWDAIAKTLFDKLVIDVICWSFPVEERDHCRLPPYDLLLPAYKNMHTLEVTHLSLSPGRWIFHAFGTVRKPFDIVEVRQLSVDGQPISEKLESCPLDGTKFYLRLNQSSELIKEIEMVIDSCN